MFWERTDRDVYEDNFEEELGCDNKYFADVGGIPVDLLYYHQPSPAQKYS